MARYLPRDADFVLGGDDTHDELLPRPRDLDPRWVRYAGRPAAYLLAASVVAGCVLRAAGTDDDPPQPVATPVSPVAARHDAAAGHDATAGHEVTARNDLAAQGITVGNPVNAHDGGGLISDDLSDACPQGQSCLTSTTVPPALLAALRAAFPQVDGVSVRTVSGAGRLLGRIVHADAGLTSVTVQVLPGRLPSVAEVTGTGNGAIATVQRPGGSLTVRTTVAGTGVSARPDAAPARLAADPRVLALT